jgi:hypothetical protein
MLSPASNEAWSILAPLPAFAIDEAQITLEPKTSSPTPGATVLMKGLARR